MKRRIFSVPVRERIVKGRVQIELGHEEKVRDGERKGPREEPRRQTRAMRQEGPREYMAKMAVL